MLFNSVSYLVFFPLVLALYWLGPTGLRLWLLLLASYVFYMSWLPQYGLLLAVLTVGNFFIGRAIHKASRHRKKFLWLGLILNLGTLSLFKYANFFLSSLAQACGITSQLTEHWWHASVIAPSFVHLNIILPLGISFFAFEFIHYLSDVYKGGQPIKNFRDFALFAAFFPSQIAGPIKRYQDFCHQLEEPVTFQSERAHQGMVLILQGLFKKIAMSDNLATLVEIGFRHGAVMGTFDTWLATLAFALQIYFDFSGYTDMGRGSALLLGFSLPDNFNFPYIASNLSDFWKRWHISLSSWLRDYLYIPLGGGRCSKLRKYFNLIVTMLLGGLWHGAAWHYVAWGGLHGFGLVVCHEYDELAKKNVSLLQWHASKPGMFCSALLTFLAVLVGWVLFRADTVAEALTILARMFTPAPSSALLNLAWQSTLPVSFSLYSIYALLQWGQRRSWMPPSAVQRLWRWYMSSTPLRTSTYLSALIVSIGFAPSKVQPFIYFQF